VTQDVEERVGGRYVWNVRISERLADGTTRRHHERIGELGVELSRIDAALAERFEPLERSDGQGARATDESRRAYFACRRRARG